MSDRLAKLGFTSYDAYLRSPQWQRMRLRVGERDNWTCACGAPATQTHHNTYARIGRERLSDLHAICGDCHTKIHGYVDQGSALEAATMAVLEGPDFYRRGKQTKKEKRKAQRARRSARRRAELEALEASAAERAAQRERERTAGRVQTAALDATARRIEAIGLRERPIKREKKKGKSGRRSYGELSIRSTTETSSPAGASGSHRRSSRTSTA